VWLASVSLIVRSSGPRAASLGAPVARAIRGVNPQLSATVETMHEQIDGALAQERVLALLSGAFGVLALFLASVGLYGVTAYAVARRRVEMGIRMALGATPGGLVRIVLARVWVLIAAGVAAGAGASAWASRFIASLLYGLQPRDPVTLAAAAIVLAAVAITAAWVPAWRASRIDPAEVLREM
jgi:ABC-type antimicrobial peptide transport system permease subunit